MWTSMSAMLKHYEISRYGRLKAWAEMLGMDEAAELLDETLQEEKETDSKLTDLAESEINVEADEEEDQDEAPAKKQKKSKKR